ncbi:MAG: rhomboid family intramembrane serine protease [Archaeoglobus sp.]|nr:rhomboid family intramembrane serine protease [Archaeoglobus sp.]
MEVGTKCDFCGKEEYLPFECRYCGGKFCAEHRLPEAHNCEGIKNSDYWNVPVKVKRKPRVRIPVREERHKPVKPKVKLNSIAAYGYNNIFLGIITLMFFIGIIFRHQAFYLFALFPDRFLLMPWQLITSIFFHMDFGHYLVNAIVLLFFGGELERRVGGKNYLKIFLLSGLAGNIGYLAFALLSGSSNGALGASGAIYGVMGTLAIIAPEIRVLFFFFIPMSIRMALLIFAAYDLFMLPLSSVTGVAHAAHLAGLVVGLYYGEKLKILRKRWPY